MSEESDPVDDRFFELVAREAAKQLPPERVEHIAAEDLQRSGTLSLEWSDDKMHVVLNGQPLCTLPAEDVLKAYLGES